MAEYNGETLTGTEVFAVGDTIKFTTQDLVTKINLPSGKIKIECNSGGYSVGTLNNKKSNDIYVHSGKAYARLNQNPLTGYGSAGKQTYVSLRTDSLYSRVIVAGATGAPYTYGYTEQVTDKFVLYIPNVYISQGGGLNGGLPNGGTQRSGSGFGVASSVYAGDGWYGGYFDAETGHLTGGGGGSGYVYTSSTASDYPNGCLLTTADYLENASTNYAAGVFTNFVVLFTILEIVEDTSKLSIKVGGAYVSGNVSVKVNGEYKAATKIYVKVNGEYKEGV